MNEASPDLKQEIRESIFNACAKGGSPDVIEDAVDEVIEVIQDFVSNLA